MSVRLCKFACEIRIYVYMNDDKFLRTVKDLEQVGGKWWPKEVRDEAMKVSIHPISKWLLRSILDNLYAENVEQLSIHIGESVETLDKEEYKQLQQDLVALGYSMEEVCRGLFDEDSALDNMSLSLHA